MVITYVYDNWYIARYSFVTKYGSNAIAIGFGSSRDNAFSDCMRDSAIIDSILIY